jgi:hypothetical protein
MKKKLFLIFFFFVVKGYAQDIYTFNGNGYWTNASNWVNNTIPPVVLPAGSSIYINTAPGDSCVLNTIQTINPGAFLIVSLGSNFIISGGMFTNPQETRLDKLIFTYTDISGTDTTNIFQYSYDNLGRLVKVRDSFSNGTEQRIEQDMTCYYSGTDTLPYKFQWYTDLGVFQDSATIFITYNNNGKRIADTGYYKQNFFEYEGLKKITRKYEYSTGLVYGTSFDSLIYEQGGTTMPINVRDTNWLDANGNVIKNKRYDFYTNRLLRSGDYNFDNHPNPLYHLGIARAYNIFPTDYTEFWFFPQPNNMISGKENTENFGLSDIEYSNFEYLPNAYPKQFVRASVTTGKAMVYFIYR